MNKNIVLDFIKAINEHDVEKICALMCDDHKFIDSHGNEVTGKETMRAGWQGYFGLFPDYKIEITDIFEKRETTRLTPAGKIGLMPTEFVRYDFIVAFGFAGGSYGGDNGNKENHFRLPASWKAMLEGGKIKLWQVYCDTKIPYDIIERNKK
jgi:hypothetical protein